MPLKTRCTARTHVHVHDVSQVVMPAGLLVHAPAQLNQRLSRLSVMPCDVMAPATGLQTPDPALQRYATAEVPQLPGAYLYVRVRVQLQMMLMLMLMLSQP